jgi:uncharacterized Zn-binding protein involved in type VI secretion
MDTEGSPNVFVNGYPVHRVGDGESHGGIQVEGDSTVFANSIQIARVGDLGAVGEPIPPYHSPNNEATGSPNVFSGGPGVIP